MKNRKLSIGEVHETQVATRKTKGCGAPRCKTCPLLFSLDDEIIVNGQRVLLDKSLSCKSKNVVYLAQCTVCKTKQDRLAKESDIDPDDVYIEDSYIGQTVSEVRNRMSGHRSSFKVDKEGRTTHAKSALAQHCFEEHPDQMELSVFKVGFVTTCKATDLDREETRLINKLRTKVMELNRIKVIR